MEQIENIVLPARYSTSIFDGVKGVTVFGDADKIPFLKAKKEQVLYTMCPEEQSEDSR